MKKILSLLLTAAFVFCMGGCSLVRHEEPPSPEVTEPEEPKEEGGEETEEEEKADMEIVVGDAVFTVTLYDNEATAALKELLPLSVNMSELNGNEKYYYLSSSLPTLPSAPLNIHTGDLMLYGDSCMVLFYESFSTSYRYTPLGRIDAPAGLAGALGTGSVHVTFR